MTTDDDLSKLIRRHATRHRAPEHLRASIRAQVALADAGRAPVPGPAAAAPPARAKSRRPWLRLDWGWGSASVGFAMGLLCMALLLPLLQRVDLDGPLDASLVAGHVRALQEGPLVEVVSSDRHTVKPWFQGRIDYAPPVLDLAAAGFPLTGGRIEHVRGRAVATLAYEHRRHVVDLFVWPSDERRELAHRVYRGFNVLTWADGSMRYWAVSDMDRSEVAAFARAWQEQAARH